MLDCFDFAKTAEGKQKFVIGDSFILCNCINPFLHSSHSAVQSFRQCLDNWLSLRVPLF